MSAQGRSKPLGVFEPTSDVAILEDAAERLTRLGDVQGALRLWTIALRLRAGIWKGRTTPDE